MPGAILAEQIKRRLAEEEQAAPASERM